MSDEMKMNDVFKNGCNAFNSYLVDDYEDPDDLTVIANFDMDYVQIVGEKMAYYAAHAIKNHDRLTEENKKLHEALEQAKAMSIESINREDLVILISTGFRHAEIKGSFEIDDLYDAFDSMVYKRKKLLSEIGGE